MTNSLRSATLLNRYEFLEKLAINCMGKKYLSKHKCSLPSEARTIANRVDSYDKLETLLIDYLAIDVADKKALRSILRENEDILRFIHAQDLYFDNSEDPTKTYLRCIAIPLFMIRLSLIPYDHKKGFIGHLFCMLEASFQSYPKQLKIYIKGNISNSSKELGIKKMPSDWVRLIKAHNYPTILTFENSLSDWKASQEVNRSKITQLVDSSNAMYKTGLFVKALRQMIDVFPCNQSIAEQRKRLIQSGCHKNSYLNIMQSELKHLNADNFLSTNKEKHGSKQAHRMLFTYKDDLFVPYVFQQQFKNQFKTEKRIVRLNNIFVSVKTEQSKNEAYFNSLDLKSYMIRALFSATMTLTDKLSIHDGKYIDPLESIYEEITSGQLKNSTERDIIALLSLMLEDLHNRWNAGEACRDLAIFIYCFRINEQSSQPHTSALPERVFWDTNKEKYDVKTKFYTSIGAYNTFIGKYTEASWKTEFICNPFKRLESCLKAHFESGEVDFKKSVNSAFKKKRAVIVDILNKNPYEALIDITHDLELMVLTNYLNDLLPNIKKYRDLPKEEQQALLQVLAI